MHMERRRGGRGGIGMRSGARELKGNRSEDCLGLPWQLGPVALYLRQYSGLDRGY